MNRSFRAPDSSIQASLRQRPGSELGNIMKEKEEELALFLDMRKREKDRSNLLLQNGGEFGRSSGSNPGSSLGSAIATSTAARRVGDDFLNMDGEKNDCDWLLTPPGTPMFSSMEKELHGPVADQIGTPKVKVKVTVLKSRLSIPLTNSAPRSNPISRQSISSPSLNTSSGGLCRPSSSASTSSTASRSSTPTGRSILPAATKPTRASTPTSRPTLPSTKPMAASAKPYTTSARSSTPTARPMLPSKTSSRLSTPRRSSMPSTALNNPGIPARSSSVTKSRSSTSKISVPATSKNPAPETSKNPVPSRTSPTVRSRPWEPSKMPGFSLDAPPNLRTSVPERPVSASRERPAAPSSLRSDVSEANSNGRPRRQSCSPMGLRGRAPISGNHGSLEPSSSKLHSIGSESGDTVSPVVMGNKMVERVINMRRLAPPRQDDLLSSHNNPLRKPSPDNTGFGRTFSKKSLDMALRHMDISRSIPKILKPIMTSVPASSLQSIKSLPMRSRPVSISDSPLATSSNASSVSNNFFLDLGEKDDMGSERGDWSSPAGQPSSVHRSSNNGSDTWLHNPEIRENHV